MSLRRNSVPRGAPSGHHGVHAPSGGVNGVLDCTSECRAKEHALLVLSSAYLGNLKLLRHCASICGNPVHIQDPLGRNALHVASSQGHLHLIQWLVAKKRVKVDLSDWESKWTALHRSTYYGQLGAAALLAKHGADLNAADRDGWSPLSILNADRECMKASLSVAAVNVYTWGRNPNDTLGHDRSRKHPEKLELSLSPTNHIIKVVLCKFHSVFLSCEGQVLSCGHGPGGRLGHDSEQSIVTPRLVKAMEKLCCVGIAAARDHTVFLTKSGAVYTCGLNDAHQLGHGSSPTNAPANYLAPKQVRNLKSKHVIAVGAGRYHTAMSTDSEVYTVGKNLGQLGYEKTSETQVAPHAVAGINLEDGDVITHMSVSDSATAVLTRKNHVFVCTDFIVKHIRLSFLDKLKCVQFEVCASLSDRDYLRKIETEPTKLLMLDSEHKVWLWEPTRRGSFPNIFPGLAKYNVTHFSLGKSLTIVTSEGEVYRGNGSVSKPLNLQRVHNIQNASAVFADFKANNFAYLQNVYGSPSLPSLSPSTLTSDLSSLLEESSLPDSVSDIKIEVAGECFLAHKFILGSRMEDFMSRLVPSDKNHHSEHSQLPTYFLKAGKKFENPDVFSAFLHYIYGSHIRVLPPPSFLLGPHVDHSVVAGSRGVGGGLEGVESTPDTSFTSLDENDLTEEYDRFYVSTEQQHDDWIDMEPIEHSVITGQSTPRKRSISRPSVASVEHLNRSWSEPEKVIQLSERRAELKLLQLLAATFDLTGLKKMLEEIMPHLYKPRTLLSPRPRLRRLNEFSDLTLISKDGKAIHCHRCVLVARSEYFRAMLLMGWKESSDDLKSLSMPVGHRVLKAVIDFIYTDEFSASIKGAEMVEWVMAVLVMADQLLLTRLKELCEFSLATILNLKNAVEFLEFAETYSALQLKKSSLQFICVNASCFLESRSLDSVDASLLDELSQSYRSLVLPNAKRVIKFPEPSFDMLPESYFHDDGAEEAGVESGGSECEDGETVVGAEVADVTNHTITTIISPRAASNSRRKRKRKSSQSEKKQPSKSPPPVDEEEMTIRVNPSPPIPASPISITSPCSPENALASDCTPRLCTNTSCDASTNSGTVADSSVTPTHKPAPQWVSTPTNKPAPDWVSIEKKRRNSSASQERNPKGNDANEELVWVSRSNSVPTPNHHHQQQQQQQVYQRQSSMTVTTPLSAPGNGTNQTKKALRNNQTRTRLMNKFNAISSHPEAMDAKKVENDLNIENKPSTVQVDSAPRGPWARIGNEDLVGGKSLREIMAKEKEIQQKNRQRMKRSSSPPQYHTDVSQACTTKKSQPIPVVKGHQKDNSLPSPSNTSSSPASTSNPWKTPESAPPALSMRALIAEAEAEDKHTKMQPSVKVIDSRPTKRQPVIKPHQPVSFASIIKSQESESNRNKSPVNKALSLIQIEEHAISELEKLYSAAENPDEYIVIKRCSKNPLEQELGKLPLDSPWSRELQ